MWLIVLLTTILSYYFYVLFVKPMGFWKERGIKYVKPLPIVGNFLATIIRKKHFVEVLQDLYNQFPNEKYIGVFFGNQPHLMIKDLGLMKKILIKDFDHFMDHTKTIDVDSIMSKNLLHMRGHTWKEMRATLSPVFTSSKIKQMARFMDECAINLKNNISINSGVNEYNVRDLFTKFSNDVIASTAFGIQTDSIKDNGNNEFYKRAKNFTTFTAWQNLKVFIISILPIFYKMFKIKIFQEEDVVYFHTIVQKNMKKREEENIMRPDLIHLLLQAKNGKLKYEANDKTEINTYGAVEESHAGKDEQVVKQKWTEEELTAQCLVFFLAGFETSSVVSVFMAYELAINPDIQTKLQNEIDSVMEETYENPKYDDIMKMKYLEQVLLETLRKWGPGFMTDRQCTKDYTLEDGVVVEAGTTLMIPIWCLHRNPKYFPNPDTFDPDRFCDENKDKIISGSFMPFGIGPRHCIASRFALLELKILFFHMLAKFDIIPTKNTVIPFIPEPSKFGLTPNKMVLGIKPRVVTNL